jgi:hypothetical protein
MQLFFYSLCSKAMPANFTVAPASSDICSAAVAGRIGQGAVERVASDDCCAACLARPWCLAWTEAAPGTCELKDNSLPEPGPRPPTPSDYQPHHGNCGETAWQPAHACNGTGASGALRAREHGVTTLAACEAYCASCAACSFVSFSIGARGIAVVRRRVLAWARCVWRWQARTGASMTTTTAAGGIALPNTSAF